MLKSRKKMLPLPRLRIFILCILLLSSLSILYSLLVVFVKRGPNIEEDMQLDDIKMLPVPVFVKESGPRTSGVHLDYVVVHLDFKGMPPKLKYLESLLVTLRSHGVNGLLMEYEDMFPFEGKLANLSVTYHYNKNELRKFLRTAVRLGFEIIPLVQTFGHMEFVLKLQEYKHLRENPKRRDSICPSQYESLELIKEMLTQVIEFHNSIAPLKHIHIGCDEVYEMNKCTFCKNRHLPKLDLYMNHVLKVADIIKLLTHNTTVLIWNDILLEVNQDFWKRNQRINNVEVVYWHYRPDIYLSHPALYMQHKVFPNIWIASAFKGADGTNEILPNITNRALNTMSWMTQIRDYRFGGENTVYNFKGIFLTGWSRYNHFGPICDLLVPSLPSLLFDLQIVNQLRNGVDVKYLDKDHIGFINGNVQKHVKHDLSCELDSKPASDFTSCKFEGRELYIVLKNFVTLMRNITDHVDTVLAEHRMGKTFKQWCANTYEQISKFRTTLPSFLTPYYEKRLINEYVHIKWLEARNKMSLCFLPKTLHRKN